MVSHLQQRFYTDSILSDLIEMLIDTNQELKPPWVANFPCRHETKQVGAREGSPAGGQDCGLMLPRAEPMYTSPTSSARLRGLLSCTQGQPLARSRRVEWRSRRHRREARALWALRRRRKRLAGGRFRRRAGHGSALRDDETDRKRASGKFFGAPAGASPQPSKEEPTDIKPPPKGIGARQARL